MEETDIIRVENAGIILIWPFLTVYFERLGMMEGGNFKDSERQNRALYLLQYLTYAAIDFPEYALPLNKVLSGVPVVHPVIPLASLTSEEIAMSESLLDGFKANWPKMEGSSPVAVQESFLQREGLLSRVENGYNLKVERRGIDILMQEIPWNLSLIKLPWMEKPLQVEWL